MQLTFSLSSINWSKLASSEFIQFTDKIDKQILAQFQSDLLAVECKFTAQNQQRFIETGIEYP
jgi:arachidonate 15-lipoxygenase